MDEVYINKDLAILYTKTIIKLSNLIEENIDKDDYSLFYEDCVELFGEDFTEEAITLAIRFKRLGL